MEEKTMKPQTVFQTMQQSSSLPPEEKSLSRLSHEGTELFLAGSGPTSRTMAAAVFFLVSNPSALARLREEIWKVMPDFNFIPPASVLEELPWLVRCVSYTSVPLIK
jgi:cytochrome P450